MKRLDASFFIRELFTFAKKEDGTLSTTWIQYNMLVKYGDASAVHHNITDSREKERKRLRYVCT